MPCSSFTQMARPYTCRERQNPKKAIAAPPGRMNHTKQCEILSRPLPIDRARRYSVGGRLIAAFDAAEFSAHANIPLPVFAAATATYQQALLNGHGAEDKGAMIRVFVKLLGVEFSCPVRSGVMHPQTP
jgi:hypothetical protein